MLRSAWTICESVHEHDGGLAVVADGAASIVSFPPASFIGPEAPSRELVEQWMVAWIARAREAKPASTAV